MSPVCFFLFFVGMTALAVCGLETADTDQASNDIAARNAPGPSPGALV